MDIFYGILFGAIIIALVISLIVYIVTSIGECFLFKKASVPGWQAFIPFLNTYRLCEIARAKDFFIWMIVLQLSSSMVSTVLGEMLDVGSIAGIIGLAISVIQIWINAVVYKRIAEAFGYDGWGWVILMIFLAPIIFLIMGLNDTRYEEPAYELTMSEYLQRFRK